MSNDAWRQRLATAVDGSGKSMRAISLAAGMGPGYLHSVIKEGKEPTISSLIAICREIGASLGYILLGQDVSSLDEEFLTLITNASEPQKRAILEILRSFASSKE